MDRYKKCTNESFVYSYTMPKEIELVQVKPVKQKRKLANIIFRKQKNKTTAVVAYSDETNATLSSKTKTNKINDKNQMTLPNTNTRRKSTRIKLHHDKRNKLNMNCCKIS